MDWKHLVTDMLGESFFYSPRIARTVGGAKAGILLAKLLESHDTWICKTLEDWGRETALSTKEIQTARRVLRDTGVLEEKYKRLEHRLYLRVNTDKLARLIAERSIK